MQHAQQPDRELVTPSQYARSRGLNRSTVSRQIRDGIIPTVEAAGRRLIDPAEADACREQFLYRDRGRRKPGRGCEGQQAVSLGELRQIRELYMGLIARLDYLERSGELLPKADVEAAQFNTHRVIRDSLLNIPDRVCGALLAEVASLLAAHGLSAELAAQLDLSRVHSLLDAEVRRVLEATVEGLEISEKGV